MSAPRPPVSSTNSTHFPSLSQDIVVKPNPHPYAIRTTSTGILSRSNSSGHNAAASRHHYVPLSPAPKGENRRSHRYSKSLTEEPSLDLSMPRPLPIPPTFTGNGREYRQSKWYRDGSISPNDSSQDVSYHGSATVEDLPSNPKLWTPAQVSTYLYTALRVMGPEAEGVFLSMSAVEDIIAFTREANINGRIFLRLIAEDLDKRGIKPAWRDALLIASCNLRQNVIKGRIWGRDSVSPESASPSLPCHPFTNFPSSSSSSSLDLTDEDNEKPKRFQRRRGRVRGMVETFERSGSFSSEGSLDADGLQGREELGQWLSDGKTSDDQVISSLLVTEPLPLASPSPARPLTEEPTVQTLLAESERMGSWGARAWEEFDVASGVTVKRADLSSGQIPEALPRSAIQTIIGNGSGRLHERGSVRLKAKPDRRVVTAIFTPAASDSIAEETPNANAQVTGHRATDPAMMSTAKADRPHTSDPSRELALQAELAETRALVDIFRARLEEVERKVAEMEQGSRRNDVKAGRDQFTSLKPENSPQKLVSAEIDPEETAVDDALTSTMLDSSDLTKLVHFRSSDFSPSMSSCDIEPEEDLKASHVGPDTATEPSLVSELPQYVLLVGLGVCAVVFRVIMKKAVGRGSSFSWRF